MEYIISFRFFESRTSNKRTLTTSGRFCNSFRNGWLLLDSTIARILVWHVWEFKVSSGREISPWNSNGMWTASIAVAADAAWASWTAGTGRSSITCRER